jgi:hypothetical protein
VTNEARDALIGSEHLSEKEIQQLERGEEEAAAHSDLASDAGGNGRADRSA